MKLEKFDFKNMPFLVERVKDLWGPPEAEEHFRRLYAEQVIRMDMRSNDLQFQLSENQEILAIVCASKKGDEISSLKWWQDQYETLSPDQQFSFNLCREYLSFMDEKTYSYMKEDDIKLDLFISIKSGYGKKLLNSSMKIFKNKGIKNIFLWTDCECNVKWYFDNNYELVEENTYDKFSTEGNDYKTYIFKKEIF